MPVPDRLERAKRYREKAEGLRVMARHWIGDSARATIGEVARQYDAMADQLERRGADSNRLRPD
jgi:hypothetical protein